MTTAGNPSAAPSAALFTGHFRRLGEPRWAALAAALLIAAIALADRASGYELRLAMLNLLPIALLTWVAGRAWGLGCAALAAGIWVGMFSASHRYTAAFYHFWEGLVTALTFVIVVLLLTRLREALARSDARFTAALEQMQAAVCVEDPRAERLLFSNQRYVAAFGRQAQGGEAEGTEERRDAASGRWYLVQSRVIEWLDGRRAVLRILADITEVKRDAESLQRHRELLDNSSRLVALGELGSSLAHELNQPLAAIATYLETCARALAAGVDKRALLSETLEKCSAQALRAGAIVNRLRDLLRHRRGGFAPTDLNQIVKAHARLLEPRASEQGIRIALQLQSDLPQASADALLIEQVLMNLLRNAIEAALEMPPERRALTVRTERSGDGDPCVSVIDGAGGVPAEAAQRIFEPFFTTTPGGLGLGLGICRSILETHGGRLWHQPVKGGGAMFRFTLPALIP